MKKVCVAICNYNHQKWLDDSIKSILSQDHENLDVIVIDDGSKNKDYFLDIVNPVKDKRFRYFLRDKNAGKWSCLNQAFSLTDSDFCTSHDADDISLPWRISSQLACLEETKTIHNLCGFHHCWNENDVENVIKNYKKPDSLHFLAPQDVFNLVLGGYNHPGINHYYTGDFETAGTSAMFLKFVWNIGLRFNPPNTGLRVLHSEDSDFNCRVTLALRNSSLLLEKPYIYRRNTSTNKEEI